MSIISFNCQSLHAHAHDLTDRVTQKCYFLMLSETLMNDQEPPIPITNFNLVSRFRRSNLRNAGTAIYCRNADNNSIRSLQPVNFTISSSAIGDLCAVECSLTGSTFQELVLISVYISPNKPINNIIEFFATNLLKFSIIGSQALSQMLQSSTSLNRMIVLAGDFNVNFSLPSSKLLIEFLLENFGIHMINRPNRPTTKGGTTIDAVFCTNPENIEFHHLTSYYSYHNPILFFTKL